MVTKPVLRNDESFELTDVLDLSIADMLILQYLLRTNTSIPRKALLEDLNSYLGEGRRIVTQTFYNKVDKLKENGFIETSSTSKGKIHEIWTTEKAKAVMEKISELSLFGTINYFEHSKGFISEFNSYMRQQLDVETIGSLLIINLEEGIDLRSIELIGENVEELYIVSNDEQYQNYLTRNMPSRVHQTKHSHGILREPEGFFEISLLLGYECAERVGKSHIDVEGWIKEAIRVTKPGGVVIISSVETIPKSDHFIIEHIARGIRESEFIKEISKEERIDELKEYNLEKIDTYSYNGLILGWGFKPQNT
ncbi:MAG: hypothetical protein ACXACB_09990 [Promethearchaeota archaeon]|jgi:hypothetical protein